MSRRVWRKLGQQMNDVQGLLQSIDGKISGGASSAQNARTSGAPPLSARRTQAIHTASAGEIRLPQCLQCPPTRFIKMPCAISAPENTISRGRSSAITSRIFPTNDLASNAQFYLGEIAYAQGDYQDAIAQYEIVTGNYPKSFKLAAALLKKAFAEVELGMKSTGIRDLRELLRRFPGSDEARRAQAKLKELGVSTTPRAPASR